MNNEIVNNLQREKAELGLTPKELGNNQVALGDEAGYTNGVPNSLVKAVIKQESGGNPAVVSKAGAIGLMQLMPDTAKELGVDPWDANQNIQGGTKYLKQQFDKYQDWEKALAAYNAGPGTVDKAIAMGGDWKANMAKIQSPENFLQTKQYVENLSKFSNSTVSDLIKEKQKLFGDQTDRVYDASVLPDPTKGVADENTDWVEQGALNTKWENIKNSFLQGIDQTQQSSDFNLQDDAQRILDEYPDKKSDLDNKLQSGTIDQSTYMQELQELNNLAQTASVNVQKYQKDIDSNTAEIKNEPVSKKYQIKNWLVQGQGSQADLWDKLTYSYPQVWGSSASLMGQSIAGTFGGKVFQNLAAAALGVLAPEPVASKVAAGVALTTALGLLTNSRRIESNSEVGDAIKQNQQTLLENWQKYHPGQEPTEEDLRRIRMQARVGKDQLFNENMALAIPDIVEALIMPGNKLGDLITGLSKPLKGLERGIEAVTDASKLTRNISRFGRLYTDYLKEKGEEGFQYAASQRQQDHALNLGLYENQGLISSILTDAYDTMASINYSPIGVVRNEDGRYSHDPNFQFSEEAGGMLSLLNGGAVSIPIGIYKDLRAYSKYTKELTGTPFDHAEDKLLRLKTEVLQKAFDTDTVHHLIEGLKSVSQQKDINGNPLLSEEDLQKEISNIKTAYHKYAAVNDYIDTLGGFFDSKESKIAKRIAKQDLFNTIIGLTKANTEEKDLQDQKTKLRLNSKDQDTFNYRDLEHQIKFKEMSIAFLENEIKNSPEKALIYDYKKQIEILKEQLKPLKETFKNLEEPKNIIEEAPIELFKINQDLIPVQARKQLHQNNYNKLLNLKNLDDYKKHSEEKLKESEAKQKALEALNNKIKAESVKDEVKQEAVVNKEKLDAESEDEYEKIMGELITRESNTEAIRAVANTVKSKIEEHKNQINQNTKSVEILQAQLDSNLDSLSSKIDRALKSINYYQAKLQEKGNNSKDVRNLKNAREKYKTLIAQAKELQDQITDLKETIKTLTIIKQDLENRLQYYNSLLNDPSLKTLTLSELKDKKAKIEKKLSSIEKIISNIKQLLEKSIAYLKEITKVILERFTLLERFKKETKFKPDTDKLRELLNYDKSGIINKPGKERLVNYATLQKQHDLLEEEILNALEHGEISEQALEVQQERLLELQEVRSKYDRQLRYLTDLIKILIDGNKLTEIPKVEKKQVTPQILTPQQSTTEFTGKTVQKVDRFGMLADPAEVEVVSQTRLPDGSIDYITKTGEVLNTKDGWNETNKIKPSNRTIEGLFGVNHFNAIHRYNLKREQEQLEDMMTSERGKAEGATKESLLQKHGPKAFPAHFADELLSKILGTVPMSEYKKYIKLKATKVKPTKFGNIVPLGKQVRLRGKRKEGVHIILEITDPQDSKNVYALSHGYNPDFYEYLNEHNNWKPVVFTDMSIDLFKQLFKFNNQEITPETYKEFQDNWKRAKEFNDAAVIYVQQHGDKSVLPDNTFNLTPKAEFDWVGNGTPISATKFPEFQNRAVIYKLAGKEYYVNGITPETAPDGLENGSYYVEAKFPNGKILWVRLFPDTVDLKSAEAQESIDALNTVVTDAHNLPTNVDLETLRPQLNEMLRKLDFFVKSSNSKFNITFRVAKASNEENYSLKVVLVLDEGRGRDNPRQEVQVRNTFTDFTNFKKFLSGLYLTVGDTKVYVGDVTLRKNLPLDTDEKKVTNPLKQLASSTKQGIVKKWGAEFTFYPENFEFKDQPVVVTPVNTIEAKKADIERRRQEELLVPISLIKLPQYLAETIKKAVERLSVTQRYDIVKAAINGKTAQQIVSELNLIDENGRRDTEIVRQVRAYYGIPSLDAEDYKDWKISIDKINAKYDAELKALEQPNSELEAKKADIERRRQEDFNNENEFYRVIVGDEAFNDIVNSGVVRTNAETKLKKEGGIDLSNRPTSYPSFSKGKASMDYAAENPNNYIIVTEDSSIQPSKVGRHGKGTTMFPTNENGNHLKELSGEKIKVYKHIGNGEYILVYANGKEINAELAALNTQTEAQIKEVNDFFGVSDVVEPEGIDEILATAAPNIPAQTVTFTPEQEEIYRSLLAAGISEEDARRTALETGTGTTTSDKVTGLIDVSNPFTVQQAREFVQDKFGDAFTVQDINTLVSNAIINGTRVGTVLGKSLYIANGVSRTYTYHEAFHALFNNLLSPRKQFLYRNKIKSELNYTPDQLAKAIADLRSTSSQYDKLSDKEMETRVYEEALADKYADWQNKQKEVKSVWRILFEKIRNFINTLLGNQSIIHLFNRIDSGAFKNSSFKDTRTGEYYKIIKNTSPSESNHIIYTIAAGVLNSQFNKSETGSRILNAFNAYAAAYDLTLPHNIEFIKSRVNVSEDLLAMKKFHNKLVQNKDLILSEVTKFLKQQGYQENVQDFDSFTDDDSELNFDAMSSEYDPSIRVGAQIKKLLATTLYKDFDMFGREVQTALPWREVYNRMLPTLSIASTSPSDIMSTMKAMSAYNKQIHAFYNRIVQLSGYDQDKNGVGVNGKNILTQIKKAFELNKILYMQARDNGDKYELFIENKRDLNETTYGKWKDSYLKIYNKIVGDVKLKDKSLLSLLQNDFVMLEKFLKGQTEFTESDKKWLYFNESLENKVFKVFNNIGINLEKEYLKFSFSNNPEDIQNRDILKDRNIKIIGVKDLEFIRQNLDKNVFERQEGLLTDIANANANFDPYAFQKTYTDAEGKKRYSYGLDSLLGVQTRKFKEIFKDVESVKKFIEANKAYWELNPLLSKDPALIVNIMNNFEAGLAYDLKLDDNGVTARRINTYDALIYMHALFQNQNSQKYNGIQSAPVVLNQYADKSQQMWGVLPVFKYYDSSTKSFTEQGKTDLWNLFKQEYNRINGVYGNDFLANKKTPVWIHFAMFNNTADTEAMSVLAGAKVDLESVKDRVLDLIKIAVDNEVKDHLQLLTENKLETKINKDIFKLYGDLNGYLYNFTLNNTLSTIGINQLISGDYANAKNFDDYIKRVSMVNAAGFSYAKDNNPTDMHQVVFVKGSVAYINRDTKEKSYDPQYKDAEGWDEIKTDDAQVYSGLDSYVDDLARQGRLSDKIIEVVNKLRGNVIENGFPVWPTLDEIKEAGIDLIPSKQVVAGFDSDGRPVFNKMAVCYITPQLCAKYVNGEFVPLEGKEELFKKWQLLKHIDDRKITHIVPQTAAKLFFPDNALNLKDPIHKDAITVSKDQIHNIPNIYRRLQQENDSKEAGKITASNQIENILGSEIKDPATRELLDEHNRINSQMRTQVFNFVQSVLIQNNDRGDMEVLLRKFRSIVEESTPDNQMLEMLEAEGKKMKYDSNLAHLHTKFVDLFLSTYKEVFRQKVPGVKFTAMSSEGYNIKDPKTGQYRPLQGMLHKEGTTIPAEVVVSRKWADERGFRKGDQVILFRVPSQSYHSIATAKIVELLPDAYGDTIIAPSDFVWLMGMDFDVDALYAYKKAYFKDSTGKVIEYGKESTPEEKFDGYIKDLFNNNSYFKAEYSENIENDKDLKEVRKELANLKREIEKDFETRSENKSKLKVLNAVIKRVEITMAFLAEDKTQVEQLSEQLLFLKQDKSQIKDELNEIFQKLKELAPERTEKLEDLQEGIRLGIKYNLDKTLKLFNLPNSPDKLIQSGLDSKQALTNKLFDLKWRILNSPELKQAFSEPLAEKSDESIKLGKENDVEHTRINGSPLSILNARQAAVQSKGLVGTTVNGSSFVQFVTQLGLNVSEDYQLYFNGNTYNSFASTEDTRGKFDKISMTLGSIIDGMKKPFAKFLNYDFNTVNKVMLMFGLNIPEKTIDRYFIQPSIKTITKELGKTQRLTNPALPYTKGEEKEGIIVDAELSRIVKALGEKNLPKDFNITDAEMEAALKAEQQKLYTPEYYTTQYKALKLYERLMTLDKTRAHVNRILSTNRSLGTDIEDFHKILEAEKALRPKTSEPEPIPGMLSKIVQNPVLNQNITYVKDALEALTHYDISETKLAKKIFDAFVFSFGKNLSSDDRTEIKRIIIASLQLSTLRTKNNTQKFSSLLLKGNNSLSSKLLNYLQENPNNYLLRVLRFEDDAKSGYSKVTMDSRTKFTETTQDNLLNSGGRIAEKNPELYQDMFNYLVFKDSLMFKNGSFIKYMLPEMFLGLAKASQEVNRLLTEEKVNEEAFKQLVGMNTREFIDMTIENYIRHSINKNKLRSRTADYYQGTSLDRTTITFTKSTKNAQDEINSPFIDENGDLKMPKWIKLEGVLLKKVKWDKNSARYEIKTMYGSSERQPYALTPAQNEAFDKAHKEIVAKQKALKEQENIPPTIWDADMAEAQREFEKVQKDNKEELLTIENTEIPKKEGEDFVEMQRRVTQNINIRKRIEIAEKYNITQGKFYSFSEIKKIFNNNELFNHPIYKQLNNVLQSSKLTFRFGSLNRGKKSINGYYNSNTNSINIDTLVLNVPNLGTSDFKRILLHEIIHSVTFINLAKDAKLSNTQKIALNNLNNIIEELNKDKDFFAQYGLKNVNELLAELANERFVDKLKNKKFNSNQNFFEKIISEIVKLLGLETTAYDIVKESFDNLVNEYQKNLNQKEFEKAEVKPQAKASQTINIYAGTNENADLSNFAIRPFTFNVQQNNNAKYMGKKSFQSVEQAFQWHKVQYADTIGMGARNRNEIAQDILNTTNGAKLRKLGKDFYLTKFKSNWDRASSTIMKNLLKASFEQNPEALVKLLATGNAELTHTQDKGKWGKEFPKLLMEVREELRNKQASPFTELSEDFVPEIPIMTLKDGKSYSYDQINSKLLEGMGYSVEEIGKILKRIC